MSTYVTTLDERIRPEDCGADPDPDEQRADFLRDHFRLPYAEQVRRERYDLSDDVRAEIERAREINDAILLDAVERLRRPAAEVAAS